ncbi:uncharacterized protein Z518_11350 [Rhinocladiella mackenziei CBS 650.93]|uniref:Uncharacterized protein n=1 Tax=Rhinocladiella mackenziei CBS 650.93 TaxID=1442369 RepID=A0A0D2GLV2_9EURO|nr:uncharacterized protein Z518_11350 [Rhinocladiella mackenziei CBS 650.93]KIW99362.1 hypothetical protein Z518_11350 [Rhinocladiella mackenziei CBS 650.93]
MRSYYVYPADYGKTPPKGWTVDKEEMGYDIYWAKESGAGQRMARRHGLEWAKPIMRCDTDSGDCLHMFQSGGKCYIWNPIEGNIWEIMVSMDVVEIVTQMDKLGLKSLPVKKIDQISSC